MINRWSQIRSSFISCLGAYFSKTLQMISCPQLVVLYVYRILLRTTITLYFFTGSPGYLEVTLYFNNISFIQVVQHFLNPLFSKGTYSIKNTFVRCTWYLVWIPQLYEAKFKCFYFFVEEAFEPIIYKYFRQKDTQTLTYTRIFVNFCMYFVQLFTFSHFKNQ